MEVNRMAVIHPRIHWGAREVDWTWVPETTGEMVAVGRRMLAEGLGMLGFVFIAGAGLTVNGQVTPGGLGLLGMAAATGLAYALIVFAFYPISGGHINPAITIGEMMARRMPPPIAGLYIGAQLGGAVVGALTLEVVFRDFVGDAAGAASLSFNPALTGWVGGGRGGALAVGLGGGHLPRLVRPAVAARGG